MAVTRHVHNVECYRTGDNDWTSRRFESFLNEKLGPSERIVQIRWPEGNASSGHAWVVTEELIMGPGDINGRAT